MEQAFNAARDLMPIMVAFAAIWLVAIFGSFLFKR